MATKSRGRRFNLADLANEEPLPEARLPSFAEHAARTARVDQVAANPRNTRDLQARPEKIENLAESIRTHGQLQPSTVVSRDAFLAIFPEHNDDIGDAIFVQVTGARRRAAILSIDLPTIEIVVKNNLAASRAAFVSATAAENIDREDYDPIEEAQAVAALAAECGNQKSAAEQLARTPAWVTQRLNLLKLQPELHAALRSTEIPLREVRDLHKRDRDEQLAALEAWRALSSQRQRVDDKRLQEYESGAAENSSRNDRAEKPTSTRRSPIAAAIYRLGGDPVKIAATLRSEMSVEDRRTLAEELMRE